MKRYIAAIVITSLAALVISLPAHSQPTSRPGPTTQRTVDVKVALSALTALTETRIKGMADALAVVAGTQEAQSGDWQKIKPLLAVFEGRLPSANLWFARPDGSYYTLEKGLTDQNLKDRKYFPKVMAGETSIGELVVSKATGSNTAIVAVPVTSNGKVVGILGASIYLAPLSNQLEKAIPLPADMVFYALDPEGRIALHSQEERVFQEAKLLGGPSLTKAIDQMLKTRDGQVTYDFAGAHQMAVYQTAPLLGWKFAVRFPAP